MSDKSIYGSGENFGGLGDGTTSRRSSLVQMINNTGKIPQSVSCGYEHTMVLMTDGSVYGCGYNQSGELGNSTTIVQFTAITSLVQMINNTGNNVQSITCGYRHTIVKMTDSIGSIYGCGQNDSGQLGDGTTTNRPTLTKSRFTSVYYDKGYTIPEIINLGGTFSDLYTFIGIPISQLLSGDGYSYTLKELTDGGIPASTLISSGYTFKQLYNAGVSINNLILYNILNPYPDNPLIYDDNLTFSTTTANTFGYGMSVDVSLKNFKFYNFNTSQYEKYNNIHIHGNGVIRLNYLNYNYTKNVIAYFGNNIIYSISSTTIKYYFDTSNNLLISSTTRLNNDTPGFYHTIIIKINPFGIITLRYQQIMPTTVIKPVIGWLGNDDTISTDDTIYQTYDGIQPFNQSNIQGKTLIFDLTGLSQIMMENSSNVDISNNNINIYTLSEITNIRNELKTAIGSTNVYSNNVLLTSSQLGNLGLLIIPTLSNFYIPGKTYSTTKFTVTDPSSNSDGLFTYSTTDTPTLVSISGNIITMTSVGTATIRASQGSTTKYTAMTIDTSFNIAKANPILSNFSITPKIYGQDISFTIIDPSSNSDGAFTYKSSNWSVATVSGNVITINSAGNARITATQAATENFNYGTIDTSFNVTFSIPCFKKGTKILTNKGYLPIESLRKGDLIVTPLHGYVPINMIGKSEIYHPALQERIKKQLYKCSNTNYPEVFEDLIITGCHCILVSKFVSEEEKQNAIQANGGGLYSTGDKYRLPACVDKRTSVYQTPGNYTIYHLALENDNYFANYGIYANGLLVETCSKRYLKELSGMKLIE